MGFNMKIAIRSISLILLIGLLMVVGCKDSTTSPSSNIATPLTLDASEIEESSFIANWTAIYNADMYILDVSTSIEFDNYVEGYNHRNVFGTACIVDGLDSDTRYYYRVRATGEEGTSGYSEVVSVQTLFVDYFYAHFYNQMYTDIEVTLTGYGTQTVAPMQTTSFELLKSDGSYFYRGTTSGHTNQGDVVGLVLEGYDTINMVGSENTIDFYYNDSFFFLMMKNIGSVELGPLYVNYQQSAQTMDQVVIPNDSVTYNIGYYEAYNNTMVAAYWLNQSYYSYWQHGQNFTLPWADNQSVTLINNSKKMLSFENSTRKSEIREGTTRKAMQKAE